MKLYILDKLVLSFKNNAVEFLNGLASNTMDKAWNALTDIHGRLIALFDQIVLNEEEVWIVVDKYCVDSVVNHLDRYMRLSGVKMEKKAGLNVYFDCDGDVPLEPGDFSIPQKKGRVILTPRPLKTTMSKEEFTAFRVKNNIPVQGVDFQQGEFLLNISDSDYVSYTKGCFLGQEPIAKVHNRSKPSWKLTVKYEDECSEEEKAKMTSKVLNPQKKRLMGFVMMRWNG